MKLKNIRKSTLIIIAIVLVAFAALAADDAATYLIMNDIPPYYRLTTTRDIVTDRVKTISGYTIYYGSPGVVAGTDHFLFDHTDMTYRTEYQNDEIDIGMEVQVTKHAGSDSDKWLLHEIDTDFRNYYGIPGMAFTSRQINSQTVFVAAVGGREYRWLSGNKVVVIKYHGSLTQQPEPLEVINAYLTKHPSTLPAMTPTQMRSTDSKTTWIKDEIDRRLWLCDKWFYQLQLQKVQQADAFQAAVKSMNVFLDYREKYFGIKAVDEKNLLAGYLNTNNGTGIKAKLTEYKNWWSVNKDKAISL